MSKIITAAPFGFVLNEAEARAFHELMRNTTSLTRWEVVGILGNWSDEQDALLRGAWNKLDTYLKNKSRNRPMTYQEARNWLRTQAGWTEAEIDELYYSLDEQAVINAATKLKEKQP